MHKTFMIPIGIIKVVKSRLMDEYFFTYWLTNLQTKIFKTFRVKNFTLFYLSYYNFWEQVNPGALLAREVKACVGRSKKWFIYRILCEFHFH